MTYTDKVKQKEYNKEYHEGKKAQLKEKYERKEPCPGCNKLVRHCIMARHQRSTTCKKRSIKVDEPVVVEEEKKDNFSFDEFEHYVELVVLKTLLNFLPDIEEDA